MRVCLWGLFLSVSALAQSAESIPLRALLGPRNVLPANPDLRSEGTATLWFHIIRNAEGAIASASVDFNVGYGFPDPGTLTGLHIHQGNATQTGPVVLDAALPRTADARDGSIRLQAQSTAPNVLRAILTNPANFYLDLHTAAHPAGALRAQLLPAERYVWLSRLRPNPDAAPNATAAFTVISTRDRQGRLTSAEVKLEVDQPGLAGFATINEASAVRIPLGQPLAFRAEAALDAVAALFNNTRPFTLTVGTHGGTLTRADSARLPFLLDTTPSAVTVHTLRDESGAATAGYVDFALNHRFTGETLLNPPILTDDAGATVTLGSGVVRSATGRGNLFTSAFVPVDRLLKNPDAFTLGLNGVRARLRPSATQPPEITLTASAVWDPAHTPVARGGLFTVFGRYFAKASGGTTGLEATRLPFSLNGATVTIGGKPAPVLQINADAMVAQVPIDVDLGRQPVVVTNAHGSASGSAMVNPTAPAVFFDDITRDGRRAAVMKVVNGIYSQVTAANPARPGEVLVLYATGFGIAGVTPVPTGLIPTGASAAPRPVVTIGGRPAPLLHSVTPIGLPGLNQVAVVMPAAAGAGPVPLVVRIGNAIANSVYLDAAMR